MSATAAGPGGKPSRDAVYREVNSFSGSTWRDPDHSALGQWRGVSQERQESPGQAGLQAPFGEHGQHPGGRRETPQVLRPRPQSCSSVPP